MVTAAEVPAELLDEGAATPSRTAPPAAAPARRPRGEREPRQVGPGDVVLVTPEFAPSIGGVQTHVAALAESLAARGGRVRVLTHATSDVIAARGREEVVTASGGSTYLVQRFRYPAARVPDVPSLRLLRVARRAAREGALVHAHNYHALVFALAALAVAPRRRRDGRPAPARLVLTPHYHGVGSTRLRTLAHRLYAPLGAAALRRADAVVAVAASEARLLEAHFPAGLPSVTVIPNGVRVPRPGVAPLALTRPTVFTCGRLAPYKRVDVLVRAMVQLPGVDLVVAGDGPDRQSLRALTDRLGLGAQVRFLGRVGDDDLARWLASDVLFATASTVEAFGLTLADAVAAGRPAVASPLPAHRDVADAAGPGGPRHRRVRFLPPIPRESEPLADELVAAVADRMRRALAVAAEPGTGAAAPDAGDSPGTADGPRPVSGLLTWDQVGTAVADLYTRLPAPGPHHPVARGRFPMSQQAPALPRTDARAGAGRPGTRPAPVGRVGVVLAAYTEQRIPHLTSGLAALRAQTRVPDEVVLVVDNNPALAERARRELPAVLAGPAGDGPPLRVVEHTGAPGCGAARNTGAAACGCDVLVFLDDDATPAADWLDELLAPMADADVAVTGSHATPAFPDTGCPAWFPPAFNWTVGSHHPGTPRATSDVRNVWGVAMAVRAAEFAACRGFDRRFGRVGTTPLGGEETELCIRVRQRGRDRAGPGRNRVVFAPASRVQHHVPASRLTWRYFLSRCHAEGRSKALISTTVGTGDALSDETGYVTTVLPREAARGLLDAVRGDLTGLARTAAIVAGLLATTVGYVGAAARRRSR